MAEQEGVLKSAARGTGCFECRFRKKQIGGAKAYHGGKAWEEVFVIKPRASNVIVTLS